MTEFDIATPASREQVLSSILPESAKQHHEMLRQLFAAEMEYRQRDKNHEYFENLYWCAYLLFMVGDPGDSEVMWRAKHINMDTGCGFDAENMVGAGVDETIAHLGKHGFHDIARYILSRTELRDPSHIEFWVSERRRYFYGAQIKAHFGSQADATTDPQPAKNGLENPPIHYRPIRTKIKNLLLGALVLALLTTAGLWLRNEVRIDNCLDRGGRWDKNGQMCEVATE